MSRHKDPSLRRFIVCQRCGIEKPVRVSNRNRQKFCSISCAKKKDEFVLIPSRGMNYRTARWILGTHAAATYTDIKRAFRIKAKELHPDRNRSKSATERFSTLARAYKFLMHYRSPYQRERYASRAFGNRGGAVRWALVPLRTSESTN